MDGELNEDLGSEIETFLQEKGPTKESVSRNILKSTAQDFLVPLGYEDLLRQALQYSHGEGPIVDLEGLFPSLPHLTLDELAGRMKRIPDHAEAKTLLTLAMSGTFPEGKGDGKTIEFSVEENPIEIQTGFTPDGRIKDRKKAVNRIGTDKLAEKLVLPEFLEGGSLTAMDVVGKLGSTGEITLKNISNTKELKIKRHITRDKKNKEITEYSYRFQIKLI